MADFSALKTAIQTYIKQNGNEEITGEILQEILLSVVTTLGDSAINDLITALANEVAARQNADGTLQQYITNEATARGNADTALGGRIDDEETARANGDTALSNRLGSSITAENTAADQIGAEAEARAAADTALQNLIDGITDNIENGYVYAGIATPSSTPATGKVFYLALTAGTYTNFGNIEVSQGINILKYNGSAWSLDAFIGIDDELTSGSNNLPKSGNVLENIIKNGSAFDLSAYNAVDGVLATYADLDAALAALSLLPAVYKQPGMSFRFVHTSDNKYVQYRLMAQTFTTDTTQWQGVDDEPTAESDNLVKSGSVAFEIGKLKSLLDPESEILSPIPASQYTTGYAINFATGSYTPYPNCSLTNPVTLNRGEGVVAITAQYQTVCAMYKTNRPNDNYGTMVPLIEGVNGLANNIYVYAATTDNEYIGFGYITEHGLKVYKVSSDVLKNIYNLIDGKQSEINEINADINTISAEQDYTENIVASVTGSDYANYIELSIPKGEVFLAYADFKNAAPSSNTIGLKLNTKTGSGDVVKYLNNKEWTLIKPSVDVSIVGIFFYRTSVTASANGILKIKKLQSITADGKLPLYDGGLAVSGDIFVNADRKTTRVILNDAPLYLYLSDGYQVTYMYGNEPDNLTDGSYITALNGGGETILNVDAKYIGFSIVKPSAATFDNLRFIVANADSNDAKLGKTLNIIDSNTDLYPFIQGTRGTNGLIITQSNRITSQIIDFSGTIVIEKNVNNAKFVACYKAKGADSWTEIATWVQRLEYTGDGQLFINISANSVDINPADAANFGINYFIKNTPDEVKDYPQYNFSVIGQGTNVTYYDEPDIILRKNRRYKITFDGVLATNAQSGEILNVAALNVDNPEEAISIAYRTADNTTIPTTRYITTPYDCYIRQVSNLTKDSYLDITIKEEPTSMEKAVNQVTSDVDKINLLINNLKCKQFIEGDLITEVADLLVFGAGISIDSGGEFYVGIMWAENAAGEYSEPQYNTGLIIGNILDPYGTKQRYVAAHYGDVIVDGIGYDAIGSELIAKKINSSEVAVFATSYYLNGNPTAATRIFNLNSKTFGDFQKCYLNVVSGGTTYRFQMRGNESDMRQIHQLTGMHNWDDVPAIGSTTYSYYAGNNPIKIGDYFYVFINIGQYAPALVRTQDFIDFYYVCELPFGKTIDGTFVYNPTEEVALAYMNNRLYASCRGNNGRFIGVTEGVDYYGYNQIMSANFDDILAGTAQWDIVDLEPYYYEKPSMVAWNNQIYLLTGAIGTWSYKGIEGKNLNRFKHMFFVFDRNLNILKKELLNPDDGWLHPTFEKYNNSVYSVNHTDVRNYTYDGTGNNRSELKLKRLDMQLLGM